MFEVGQRADSGLERRLRNLVRLGVVAAVDRGQARVRVRYDRTKDGAPVLTAWLPWVAERAGADRSWDPPSVGEQVVVLSPGGELAAGVVLGSLYHAAHPAPASEAGKHLRRYRDGARLEYDAVAHRLSAILPAGAQVEIQSPGGVSLTGDLTITGELSVSGDVDSGGDVRDGDGSMAAIRATYNTHTHSPTNVPPGGPAPRMV